MNIIEQNKEKINGILETFDRIIINGYIRQLQNPKQFLYYLIQNNIKLVDFNKFAEEQTKSLCEHIDKYIQNNNVELKYVKSGKESKDELAKEVFSKNPNKIGMVAAISAVEICKTMTVKGNHETNKLEIQSRNTKCKHYYLYFNDEEFGWMFIKIQTWFPYNVQIYINGHEYLSKLLDKNNIKYEMYNNSFSYLEDFNRAQEIADNILNQDLKSSFDGMIKKVNNLLPNIQQTMNNSYYWCIDQCEFATDINFKSREDLSIFYKKLIETTYFTFNSDNIYCFFGRNIKHIDKFKGEIISDLRKREQGYRIKFKLKENQLKMYDKGNNLRIEVTINNPNDFKILKEKEKIIEHQKLETIKEWVSMGKSITNLYRYIEISKSIINRYLDALPNIDVDCVPLNDIKKISERQIVDNRNYSALNIFNRDTLKLFEIISSGDWLINGFTNKSIREKYFKESDTPQNINKMTRLLAKLRAHKIIKKVAKKNKYYLTNNGRKIITTILLFSNKTLLNTI